MEGFAWSLDQTRTTSRRFEHIEHDIHEIKANTDKIKATKEDPPAKTWVLQITITISPPQPPQQSPMQKAVSENTSHTK
jgi:hypothetical protein